MNRPAPTPRFPTVASGLSPAWLTAVLGGEGREARSVHWEPVGTGQMCDTLRASIVWEPPGAGPPTVVVKLPATDPTSREAARAVRAYEKEVRFYQQLAPTLPVRPPRCWLADLDEMDTTRFVLCLEDLAPARAGDQLAGCRPDQAQVAVDELVRLHAPRWADPSLQDLPWLHQDPAEQAAFLGELLPVLWTGFQDRYASVLAPVILETGHRLFDRLDRYLAPTATPLTVIHGDYRLDNLLSDEDGQAPSRCAVCDWQTCRTGAGPEDLGYFLGASLLPEDRRAHEERLVARYHAGLLDNGVRDYPLERCWVDYRHGAWGGLVMAVAASMLVQRTPRGDQMFLCMAERHAHQALEIDPAGPA